MPVLDKPKTIEELSQTRYTGRPCTKCGGTERQVSNRRCVVCHKESQRAFVLRRRAYEWARQATEEALSNRIGNERQQNEKRVADALAALPDGMRQRFAVVVPARQRNHGKQGFSIAVDTVSGAWRAVSLTETLPRGEFVGAQWFYSKDMKRWFVELPPCASPVAREVTDYCRKMEERLSA